MKFYIMITFIVLFLIVGLLLSDHFYYIKIIKENNLKTPQAVFYWVQKNNPSAINTKTTPVPYASPKFNIINKRNLYCDEGSIVIATLDNEIGYKTRLINLIGLDSISHHTILEVYQNNTWVKYDYLYGLYNKSYETYAGYTLLRSDISPYPKSYNFIVNHNYFLKKAIFWVRGIKERVN